MTAAVKVTYEDIEGVLATLTPEQANLLRAYLQSLHGRIEMLERMIDDGN